MESIYLSKEGYEKLKNKLKFLKTKKRREISKAIGEAIAHGDISENAEYTAAKDAQGLNERKIIELEEKLGRGKILENEDIPADKVLIGATVKLKNLDTDEELQYTLVSELESDFSQRKISIASPIGQGLLGHKVGEIAECKIPIGTLRYKILNISR